MRGSGKHPGYSCCCCYCWCNAIQQLKSGFAHKCDLANASAHPCPCSYLKWVVRPDNATLTADCFDVLLRDMVALQQAAAVDGLSSGELGVQAQVRGAESHPRCRPSRAFCYSTER